MACGSGRCCCICWPWCAQLPDEAVGIGDAIWRGYPVVTRRQTECRSLKGTGVELISVHAVIVVQYSTEYSIGEVEEGEEKVQCEVEGEEDRGRCGVGGQRGTCGLR